ncbi:MAG: LPS assembly lipoprotein LptE [Pseudomonadota bacterium]
MRSYRTVFAIGLGLSTALLSACRVEPLYGSEPIARETAASVDESSVQEELRSIDIAPPQSRIDQLVRNELQFSLTGTTQQTGSLPFELDLKTRKSVRSVGISDIDFGPAAFFITVSADYVLRDRRLAAPIAQGTQAGTASFDRVDQEFANIRSEKDAEERAAKTAALKLRQALAIALASRGDN